MRCLTALGLFPIFFCLFAVAACGRLPQPFAHDEKKTVYPLAELAVDVRVAPVAGLPDRAASALAQAVAESLGGHGVTATHHPSAPSRFVLRGTVEDIGAPGTDIASLTITWVLSDPSGDETGLHVQELRAAWADWQRSDPEFIRQIGSAPARALAGLVSVDAELPASGKAGRAGLFLTAVSGAPGDGNESLAEAMRRALKGRDVALADGTETAAHLLNATVSLSPPNDGQQDVSIIWRVERPDGTPLGDAAQKNSVPAGSLDRRWGIVASYAATAAVEGIADILRRSQETGVPSAIVVPPAPTLPRPEKLEVPAGK